MDLTGKTALITGASRGIGAAAAEAFHAAGANVVLLARSTAAIGDLAGKLGASALAVPCNVARFAEMQAAVDAAVDTFGSLDVLVNNAGIIEPIAHLASSDPDAWGHTIDVNLKGVYHGIRAALPVMQEQASGGTILTVSSGAAHGPVEAWSHYCAAKAGGAMLTRCVDKECRDAGIRAIGLSPGTVATEMQREISQSGINPVSRLDWSDHVPPEWPAKALVWMCSAAADKWLGDEISLRDPAIRQALGLAT